MDKRPELDSNDYNVDYRDIKYPRLEYKTGTLLLVLPKNYQKKEQLLQKHQKWIQRRNQTIQKALQQANNKKLNNRKLDQLKAIVDITIQQAHKQHECGINKVFYRRMKTKWASLSRNNNLTINTLLKFLPQDLIKYVIYHELTHTTQRKHNTTFWKLIGRKYPNHQTKEKQLLSYWFQIQRLGKS